MANETWWLLERKEKTVFGHTVYLRDASGGVTTDAHEAERFEAEDFARAGAWLASAKGRGEFLPREHQFRVEDE